MLDLKKVNEAVATERKSVVRTRMVTLAIEITVIVAIVAMQIQAQNVQFGSWFVWVIVIVIVLFVNESIYGGRKRNYVSKVKRIILDTVFMPTFDDVTFSEHGGISIETLRSRRLVDTADNQYVNDYLCGSHNGIQFTRTDVKTESESTDSEGHTTTSTVFKGQVYSFDFNKVISEYVRVSDKNFWTALGFFKKNRVKMDDGEFNELFDVTTSNEHETFYVFTPHFMNRYKALHQKFDGRACMVIDGALLYLAINNKRDSFEPNAFSELDESFKQSLQQDIDIIKIVIDDLDLTNDLFLPQSQT